MTAKVFNTLLALLLTAAPALAQHRLIGTVLAQADSLPVQTASVYLNNKTKTTVTDNEGRFVFHNLANGIYTLHVIHDGFRYSLQTVELNDRDQHLNIVLQPNVETLNEVTVTDVQSGFGFSRMRPVENMGIYEGKKTEVIIPDQLVTNAATNNARQIFSRVAGLNIWENDGAGIQLSVGGRGLDPNRTSNFNVRQNGYDISADALGYPESYYTPPAEALGKIEIVRGAASLQYGTQFGGMINFRMKTPVTDKKFELTERQSVGSFGFYNAFTSASGTVNKVSYYGFFQYKRGNGWRANSKFDNYTGYAHIGYSVSKKTKLGIDLTHMNYLAQQPGGLSDDMFRQNPRQTNRERNWFNVSWNMAALHIDHKFSSSTEFNARVFGLSAYRHSLGFRPNRVATIDDESERDLIKGDFENWGTELRLLKRYAISNIKFVMLIGGRYYHGINHSAQGLGSTGREANFNFENPDQFTTYDFRFPNRNVSAFLENILYLSDKFSITPGVRFEYIRTTSNGYYGTIIRDLAGNVLDITRTNETRVNGRHFVIAGVGITYKPNTTVDIYANISQNYRSITFSDMRIANPSSVIDPNLHDEKGYSLDLGIRSDQISLITYDLSIFYLNYNNRIGEVQFYDEFNRVLRRRGNIGQAVVQGIEAYAEADIAGLIHPEQQRWSVVIFNNIGLITSQYKKSEIAGVEGKQVEFVPTVNLKSGLRLGYKAIKVSFQYTYLSDQYSDATNATDGGVSAIVGTIPAYHILDISASYTYKRFRLEGSVNNLTDQMYFTRRATGYPGPGILPSDGRGFYLTLQAKI